MDCPKCGAEMVRGRKGWICEECDERVPAAARVGEGTVLVDSLATASQTRALREGRYAITETLGRGGMAIVHRALDTKLKRVVAVKGILPELLGTAGAEARFLREAQAVASLDHPNVIRIHDFFAEGGLLYIVMEFFEGVSLRDYIQQTGPPDDAKLFDVFSQLTSALEAVHAKGLVHRDISPSNILISAAGQVKLIDFGLARGKGPLVTRTGAYLGKPGYTAPEQEFDAASADARADIYSLGGVLYFCLTGGQHPPRVLVPESIPAQYRDVVLSSLASERDMRFPDAASMKRAFDVLSRRNEEAEPIAEMRADQRAPSSELAPSRARASQPPVASKLFADGVARRTWDIGYYPLSFLGVVTFWVYPIVRMTRWLGILNERIARDFREVCPAALALRHPWRAAKVALIMEALAPMVLLAAFVVGVTAPEPDWRLSSRDSRFADQRRLRESRFAAQCRLRDQYREASVALLVAGGGLFYLGPNLYVFCWLLALQKNERRLLDVCVEAMRGCPGRPAVGIGPDHLKRWISLWCCYAVMVGTGWLFGVPFYLLGSALLLFPLRKYATVAREARHELGRALAAKGA